MAQVKTLKEILSQIHDADEAAKKLVTDAYAFAKEAHKDQKRYSGEPYFLHTAETSFYLAQMGMDAETISAGLLHDTVEDADVELGEIEEKFGETVAALVDGVSKLGALRYRGLERHTESLRKLFAATAKDIRVLIVKLMDRLHNARTLEHVPKHKRARIALETLEIYAPIADRLGMGIVKRKLEDAAFPYAFPKEYKKVRELLKERTSETQKRLEKTEKALKRELAKAKFTEFRTESRLKGVYSLYSKLGRKDWDITKIHDIIALRIIVGSIADCYTILGAIHGQWRPVPGKIKDYIALPKPNGYQSIHTTIYTGDGGTLEIQIRTEAMHREAQYGIASHFLYKEDQGSGKRGGGMEWIRQVLPIGDNNDPLEITPLEARKYSSGEVPGWVKELAEAQDDEHAEEYLDSIKTDFFRYRIFVFTPKGDVIDLPVEATPIDFAYAIHSDIGNHMAGAKVNGKLVSLDTHLHNGDIVEIMTKQKSKPTQKWLDMAKTTMAKRHIKSSLSPRSKR